jgi:hypothetical protein
MDSENLSFAVDFEVGEFSRTEQPVVRENGEDSCGIRHTTPSHGTPLAPPSCAKCMLSRVSFAHCPV